VELGLGEAHSIARFRHTFSHYHLDIDVRLLSIDLQDGRVMEAERYVWYKGGQLPGGTAAPMNRILDVLAEMGDTHLRAGESNKIGEPL